MREIYIKKCGKIKGEEFKKNDFVTGICSLKYFCCS